MLLPGMLRSYVKQALRDIYQVGLAACILDLFVDRDDISRILSEQDYREDAAGNDDNEYFIKSNACFHG